MCILMNGENKIRRDWPDQILRFSMIHVRALKWSYIIYYFNKIQLNLFCQGVSNLFLLHYTNACLSMQVGMYLYVLISCNSIHFIRMHQYIYLTIVHKCLKDSI